MSSPTRHNVRQIEIIDLTEENEESSLPSIHSAEVIVIEEESDTATQDSESKTQEFVDTVQAEEEAANQMEIELDSQSQEFADALQPEEIQMQNEEETETEYEWEGETETEFDWEETETEFEEDPEIECNICFIEIEDEQRAGCPALTPSCAADFHRNCLIRWLTDGRPNCPLCQRDSLAI